MIQNHNDFETEEQISQSLNIMKNTLGKDLLGFYLYGSAVVGGPKAFSDIDLFVISKRALTTLEKTNLIREFLKISGVYQKSKKRPIELLVVVQSQVNPWTYPPHFDFQYGDWLRGEFESGKLEPWTSKEMPDLALLITQLLLANKPLFGPPPEHFLSPVPYRDVLRATREALDELMLSVEHDTRNVLLTYARMWSMLMTDTIYPKPESALWAINRLPEEHRPSMAKARAFCVGEEMENWTEIIEPAKLCAFYMKSEIKKNLDSLEVWDVSERSLKI